MINALKEHWSHKTSKIIVELVPRRESGNEWSFFTLCPWCRCGSFFARNSLAGFAADFGLVG